MMRPSLTSPKLARAPNVASGAFAARLALISPVLLALVVVSLLYVTRPAHAATFTAAATGSWNLGATWGNAGNNVAGSGFPGASDTANIPNGITVTIAAGRTEACTTLNLNSNNLNNAALNFTDGTSALNVSGTATIGTPTSGSGNIVTLSVDAGTFTCNALTFIDNGKEVGQIQISTGTATVANNIALVGTPARSKILFTGAGTLNVGGSLGGGGSITSFAGSTINYNGTAQTIFPATYENLTLSGSGTKTMSAATIVNNTCSVGSGTTLDEATFQMTLSGAAGSLVVNGTLDFTSSNGLIRTGASGTTTLTMGSTALIRTVDDSGLGPAANASLQTQVSGTWVVASISTSGAVEYSRTSAQTVTDRDYNNLSISNTGAKTWTLGATRTVNGTVTINAGAPLTLSGAQIINVKGDWSNSGTFSAGPSTINFNGAANQTIGGANSTTFSTLSISNTGSSPNNKVSPAKDITVSAALNVASGVFNQGAGAADDFSLTTNNVTVSSGATWQNLGKGDLILSGDVANSGTINFNANGTSCGDADDILIRSSSTVRTWSGAGTFTMIDVNVKDQKVPLAPPPAFILVTSGTDATGNTGWVFVNQCTAGTYTWMGGTPGASTDWQVSTNWSPTRSLPTTGDILIFDGNFTAGPTVTNVPTETDAAFRLTNNVNGVTLSAATVPAGTKTLTLSGGTGTDLSVPSGSLLTLTGSTALQLSVASGSTGTVGGQIIVQGGAHRVLGNAASAVTFQNGSLFTTNTGFTGNAFGTTTAGSIILGSGSAYVHNAGSSPFGAVGGTAVCVFQGGSEARYLTATGFDANGRTYSTLTIGDGSAALTVSDSGAGDFKFDNLVINSSGSANSMLTYIGSGTSTITIQGNITSVGTGSGSLADLFLTAGSGGIQINKPGGGAVTFGSTNQRSIDFESDATVDVNTTLNLGRIVQMGLTPNKTIMVNGTIVPNYLGFAGYFIGKEKRTFAGPGPVDFTFDVGTINGYSAVDAKNTNAAGNLTVTATQSTAPVVNAATSLQRYWTLNGSGITTDLTFHYLDPTDIPGTSTEANYRIIRVDSGTSTAVSFPNECPTPTLGNACVNSTSNAATIPGVNAFSDWTLGENVAPTAVRLTGFSATTQDDGVMLEWRSGFEANNLGYNLYRYQDGQRTRVTPSLIAGSSLIRKHGSELTSGFSYGWFDPQGTMGTQYELQAIDLHGDLQTFTPRYAAKSGTHGTQKQDRALTLSEVSATGAGLGTQRGWANGSTSSSIKQTNSAGTQSLATQQWIASQPAVKIRVNRTGWYRVTQPQLVANGFDASVDARRLQLYVDGAEVPIRLSTDKPKLGSGDTVEFYGVGLDLLTTDTRTYYLVSGTRNGLRIGSNADKNSGKKVEVLAPDFLYTVESKERIDYFPGLLNGDGNNIFGQFIESVPANQTITLQNINANSNAPAQLEVVIQGYTEADHHILAQFNGSYVGTIDFSGMTNKSKTLPVNAALLKEGANFVTLTATGGDLDFGAVDVMRITYAHTYRADNDSLSFSVGNRGAAVSGFSSAAIRVIDVTNPNAVFELAPKITNSGGSFGFAIQASGTVQQLIAFVDSLARQPSALVKNHPSTWNASTNAADLVIVTHGDFRASADTLAAARRAQGMKVSVVDIEDVFDEFSDGAHTPEALKDFLSWSNQHWTAPPRYALLFGDSSWDPRNFMGQGYHDYVPTRQVDTAELETASDDWLADFNSDGIPEIALGRLPARTTADASTMVSKILNYDQERAGGAPLRGALLVADGGFEGQSAQVQSVLAPLTTVQTLNRSAIGNDSLMQVEIVDAIDQGPAIVNYFGHGSVTVWTGAGLLNEDNASTLTNGNRPSLFVMMTCLNGYAGDAYIDSLAEIVLKNPQGGAFAVWASSGITEPVGQAQMNGQLYQLLLGAHPMTLGDAVRQAKMGTPDLDVRRTWILLGDPSMRIK
ncbi:MAG TPA: C25 family cysteine peptidase [Pyrinomonadaceae bacterium]|nr:C25 family cysteine peptidase [Pyrinomonadaceae bacterium]